MVVVLRGTVWNYQDLCASKKHPKSDKATLTKERGDVRRGNPETPQTLNQSVFFFLLKEC